MNANPFTVTGARAWPLQRSEDITEGTEQLQEQEVQQLARLLGRLLDGAECEPDLYEVLPWLRNVNLWELLLQRRANARFPYVPRFVSPSTSAQLSEISVLPDTAATLLTFFARVTQPMAQMVEALYLSPLLRDTRSVYDILRGMAGAAGVKPLPKNVVVAMCANLASSRSNVLNGCRARPHPAVWNITWRRIPIRLQWTMQQPVQGDTSAAGDSRLVLVREEITHKAGVGYQQTGKVLAFRCLPDPLDRQSVDETGENTECIQTGMTLALYDALVFSRSHDGQLDRPICPPTLLRVQAPMPKVIREAASVWGIQLEEDGSPPEREPTDRAGAKREKELAHRVLDPPHYMRILDRDFERTYGYAPFLTKQRFTRHRGWLWSMHPDRDPLLNYMGLQELLPSYPAVVGEDGSIEWQGWHYRDYKEDVLCYFPHAQVRVRRSPLTEAVILVYRRGSVLCYAVAAELRHQDGTCRSYSFPYPRLGE